MIAIIIGTNRSNAVSEQIASVYSQKLDEMKEQHYIIDLKDLPDDYLFSSLYENTGKNEAFNRTREKVIETDKFIFIVPEYNGSFPGVLKSFIDGLAYPKSFLDKKGALVGISSGMQGGGLALSHLDDILSYLGMNVMGNRVKLHNIEKNFTEGSFKNSFFEELIDIQIKKLMKF